MTWWLFPSSQRLEKEKNENQSSDLEVIKLFIIILLSCWMIILLPSFQIMKQP
jgi:hypothetical protein